MVLLRLAREGLRLGASRRRSPFPLVHIDTGHNFDEVIDFRDRARRELGEQLIVRLSRGFDQARHRAAARETDSRNAAQAVTLLETIDEHGFDALIGGARRDEEKARAKERIFSFRDEFGQWDPKAQRPELWDLYNTRVHPGEHMRVFPISNWTELDVWQYIAREKLELPSDLLRASTRGHSPQRPARAGDADLTPPREGETVETRVGALPHRRRHHLHLPGRERCRRCRRRSSPRPPSTQSPSAARRGWTTRRPKPRWNSARRKDISKHARRRHNEHHEHSSSRRPRRAALHHRGQRRRRQEHADRPPAVRQQRHLRRPASALSRAKHKRTVGDEIDLSLLTDGLEAEREQGITIDVAYRYFATPKRKFIIADTPGHEQYTRNMVTGASTADAAIILVDATRVTLVDGVAQLLPQTKRH